MASGGALKIGDHVVVTDGKPKGFQGEIVYLSDDSNEAEVQLDVFGRTGVFTIPLVWLDDSSLLS